MNSDVILQMTDRKAALEGESVDIVRATNGRDRTEQETSRLQAINADLEKLDKDIKRAREDMEILRRGDVVDDVRVTGGHERIDDDPKRGFKHFGEFAMAVYRANPQASGRLAIDDRLTIGAAPTTYSGEGVGTDGGYLVPTDFASTVMGLSVDEGSFLPLVDNTPVSGNGMTFPVDETTPWGTTGVREYWAAEAAQATQSKLSLKLREFRLHKLFVLVPITDELMADAPAVGGYVAQKAGQKIAWETNNVIVNGTGAGQPEGFLTANSNIEVAKEGAQAADTLDENNLYKMYARLANPGRGTWLLNHDVLPQLHSLTTGGGNQQLFFAPGAAANAPAGTILGRPIILTDTCQTIGDAGDIQFVDFSCYKAITKAGGPDAATSMHLWFDYDVMAFRLIFRMDGAPWLSAAFSPANGSTTRSHCVSLAERA